MKTVTFTEKRPPDIEAVRWLGDPTEAHEFVKLWPDAYGFSFDLTGKTLTIDRPAGKSILMRGTCVEVEQVPDPACYGKTQLVARRVLSNSDLDGYERKAD